MGRKNQSKPKSAGISDLAAQLQVRKEVVKDLAECLGYQARDLINANDVALIVNDPLMKAEIIAEEARRSFVGSSPRDKQQAAKKVLSF